MATTKSPYFKFLDVLDQNVPSPNVTPMQADQTWRKFLAPTRASSQAPSQPSPPSFIYRYKPGATASASNQIRPLRMPNVPPRGR